ncbi:putative amidohydrolase YtcJ [Asterias amurensis]|uniref:putative amidohydrolase YtcJ n=1 Tax=Asterias amurensis TaxID=7602 RepID=UPI003AB14D36
MASLQQRTSKAPKRSFQQASQGSSTGMRATTIFYGGNIITMNENHPQAEALAVAGDTILAVGTIEQVFRFAGPDTDVLFLNKQTLMPGFIEPHQHAIQCALMGCQYVNISALTYRHYSEIYQVISDTMSGLTAGDWGIFFGWDPELMSDLPILSATFLDNTFSSTIPIVVVGQSGHVAWANTPALDASGINENTESPSGGTIVKDANGVPTGQVFEEPAIMMIMGNAPLPDAAALAQGLRDQWMTYAKAGFTTVTDLAYMPTPEMDEMLKQTADDIANFPIRLALYKMTHAVTDGDLVSRRVAQSPKVRCCSALGRMKKSKLRNEQHTGSVGNYSSRLWEAGLKLVADGSPHCGTAATREPYMTGPLTDILGFPPAPGYGTLNMASDALYDTIKRSHLQGKQFAIHCHGERSSEQVLRAYEQVFSECKNLDNRHRMEHLGLMTPEQIARAGKLNLGLSFFVDHLRFYGLVYKTDIFGDRVNRWTPISEATKNGITWTIHQDHPTFPGSAAPFDNIKTAVTRCTRDDPNTPYGPEYCVTVHEALKSYTVNAAWQLHMEKLYGSLAAGKKADLVVLDKNPYDLAPVDLDTVQVVDTFVDGIRTKLSIVKTIPKVEVKYLAKQ